jgi:hypothetical protein
MTLWSYAKRGEFARAPVMIEVPIAHPDMEARRDMGALLAAEVVRHDVLVGGPAIRTVKPAEGGEFVAELYVPRVSADFAADADAAADQLRAFAAECWQALRLRGELSRVKEGPR